MPASDYRSTNPLYPLDSLLPRYPSEKIQKYGLVALLILNLAMVCGWQQIPHFAIATWYLKQVSGNNQGGKVGQLD